ncbi:membrane protein [Arthrobacter phage Thunderclap]|uniref:Membrane protein n=1 Tax=Arthrobacter phage Thunderclap TaxID=2777309 RepID=A0A7M1RP00_9CAUD|nr:membrane protein [Arthrobacter phage Thunderclap]
MSNNVSVFSAITGAKVGEFNTDSETLESVKAKAMEFHEVRNSNVSTQLALIEVARGVFTPVTSDQTIRNAALSAVGIDRVEVKANVVATTEGDGTPAELVEPKAVEPDAYGNDVTVYGLGGVLIDSFNTNESSPAEVELEALGYQEIASADLETRAALANLLRDTYNATESHVITNDVLAKVGITRVTVAVEGVEPEEKDDTPIYSETVAAAQPEAKAVAAPLTLVKAEPVKHVDIPLSQVPVTKTVTVRRGLPAWGTAAIAAAAAIVGAVIGGGIF